MPRVFAMVHARLIGRVTGTRRSSSRWKELTSRTTQSAVATLCVVAVQDASMSTLPSVTSFTSGSSHTASIQTTSFSATKVRVITSPPRAVLKMVSKR